MLDFAPRAVRPSAPPRARLSLDALESRLTPAAPQITGLTFTGVGDNWYTITGQVIDENPWGLTVEFESTSDVIQGARAECDEGGYFCLYVYLEESDYGVASATSIDWEDLISDPVFVDATPS